MSLITLCPSVRLYVHLSPNLVTSTPAKQLDGLSQNIQEIFLKGRRRRFWSQSENSGYPWCIHNPQKMFRPRLPIVRKTPLFLVGKPQIWLSFGKPHIRLTFALKHFGRFFKKLSHIWGFPKVRESIRLFRRSFGHKIWWQMNGWTDGQRVIKD